MGNMSLHKQWSFPLRVSSVNVTKSAVRGIPSSLQFVEYPPLLLTQLWRNECAMYSLKMKIKSMRQICNPAIKLKKDKTCTIVKLSNRKDANLKQHEKKKTSWHWICSARPNTRNENVYKSKSMPLLEERPE